MPYHYISMFFCINLTYMYVTQIKYTTVFAAAVSYIHKADRTQYAYICYEIMKAFYFNLLKTQIDSTYGACFYIFIHKTKYQTIHEHKFMQKCRVSSRKYVWKKVFFIHFNIINTYVPIGFLKNFFFVDINILCQVAFLSIFHGFRYIQSYMYKLQT